MNIDRALMKSTFLKVEELLGRGRGRDRKVYLLLLMVVIFVFLAYYWRQARNSRELAMEAFEVSTNTVCGKNGVDVQMSVYSQRASYQVVAEIERLEQIIDLGNVTVGVPRVAIFETGLIRLGNGEVTLKIVDEDLEEVVRAVAYSEIDCKK